MMKGIIRYLSLFFVKYVLGWRIIGDTSNYDYYKSGKHVVLFNYTSIFEMILGYLLINIFDIKIHICSDNSSQFIPSNIEIINGNDNDKIKYLLSKNDFVYVTQDNANIAKSINADINIVLLDFENNTIRQKEIASDIIIQNQPFEEIKKIYSDLLKNSSVNKSLINIKHSILILIPPLVVIYILILQLV